MTVVFDFYPPPPSVVVISPHTDDAIFSIGACLSCLMVYNKVTIASPMAGIPTDAEGRAKHVRLRQEHEAAVRHLLGPEAIVVNGDFLDDVYEPRPTDEELGHWIAEQTRDANVVYIPLGIHHRDHIQVSDVSIKVLPATKKVFVYAELPYRILHTREARARAKALGCHDLTTWSPDEGNAGKSEAVRLYASQVNKRPDLEYPDDGLLVQLRAPEYVWSLW